MTDYFQEGVNRVIRWHTDRYWVKKGKSTDKFNDSLETILNRGPEVNHVYAGSVNFDIYPFTFTSMSVRPGPSQCLLGFVRILWKVYDDSFQSVPWIIKSVHKCSGVLRSLESNSCDRIVTGTEGPTGTPFVNGKNLETCKKHVFLLNPVVTRTLYFLQSPQLLLQGSTSSWSLFPILT